MKKMLALALGLTVALTAAAQAEQAPVTIENNGRTTVYEAAPERAVVLSYSNAELMAALGLEDRVAAAFPGMYVLDDVLPEYRDTVAAMPAVTDGLNRGTPNLETILDQDPDFVLGTAYNFMPVSCGAPEDFEAAGAHTYANEGTYVSGATLENTYNDILNLGRIFRVEERAQALVEEMRERESAVRALCADAEPVSVFVYDSGEGTLYTIAGGGLENELVTLAGGANVFGDQPGNYFAASVESIIEQNPEVIVIFDYSITSPAQEKIAYLKGLAELAQVDAVANDRFVVVPIYAMFPSIQNIDAIQTLAEGLHPELF